ncbi:hypothetical protein PO909_025397 [Leuciscus waleckii]
MHPLQEDDHRVVIVLMHLSHLGLRDNREKSKLSPVQRISFLGMELDLVNMTVLLTNELAQSVLNCLNSFKSSFSTEMISEAPGAYGIRSRSHATRIVPYVATRPPSPPVESEVTQVTSCNLHPRRAQSCGRRALMAAYVQGGVENPPPDSPADLGILLGRSGRPVNDLGDNLLPVVLFTDRERTCFFQDKAPSGICFQTSGTSKCGLWMGCGGLKWPTSSGS